MKNTPRSLRVQSCRAFTLTELLITIAIIAILASILFSVIGRVRENARKAQCGSNLRQVAMAMLLYSSERKGFFPAAADQRGNGTGVFSNALITGGFLPKRLSTWTCETHLVNDPTVAAGVATDNANTYPRSYAICGTMLPPLASPYSSVYQVPAHIHMFSAPARTVMLTEWHTNTAGVLYASSGDVTGGTTFERERMRAAATGATSPHSKSYHPNDDRHFAFVEGHVSWMSAVEANQDKYWTR